MPTSHPQFFAAAAASTPSGPSGEEARTSNVYSSINVRSAFVKVIGCHSDWAEGYVRRGGDLRSAGIEIDEAQEVIEGMRAMREVYTIGQEVGGDL